MSASPSYRPKAASERGTNISCSELPRAFHSSSHQTVYRRLSRSESDCHIPQQGQKAHLCFAGHCILPSVQRINMHSAPLFQPSPSPKHSSSEMAYVTLTTPPPRTSALWATDQLTPPPPYDFHDAMSSRYAADPRANMFHRSLDRVVQMDGVPRGGSPDFSIPHLREALTSLDSRMASLLSERELLESRLEQAVRLQAPLQRLPNELLASIFVIGVLDTGDQDSLMLSTLMLVCRHWREVATNTPALWSRITVGTHHSLNRARLKLDRSKAAPLDIYIDFSPRLEHGSVTTESVVHTMDLLCPSIWRWRTLQLTVPNRPQAHAALMRCKEQAPILEFLSVRIAHSMQEDHYSTFHLSLFAGHTPRLRSCSFTSFNFGWEIGLVSGLRSLKLGGYWNGHSPSVDVILGILRACPQLEELVLRNMSDVDPDPCAKLDFDSSEHDDFTEKLVRVGDARTIQLPRLKRASFYYSGILRTRTILSLLSFPALERIDLCFLDNVAPVVEHLRRQSLTSLPLRHLRIESSFFNEIKLVRLLRRLPALTSLELVDIEDVSSNLMRVSLSTTLFSDML